MAEKHQKELGGRNMSTGTRIIVGIFAVIMALSMTLPSLAPIFANDTVSEQEAESEESSEQDASEQEKDATEEKESDKKTETTGDSELDAIIASTPDNESLKTLAEDNQKSNEKFIKRLEEDPNDLAALLNLGQNYMNWGSNARYSGTTEEETAYTNALFKKAIEYYDRYLAIRKSDAVKIQRAMCEFYTDNTEEALKTLTTMTEEKPDYPLAWAYLGMLYEQQYDYDKAKEAYAKAVETDPDNEYGAKNYGEERTKAINSSQSNFSDLTNQELLGTDSTPTEGLAGTIAQNSGL